MNQIIKYLKNSKELFYLQGVSWEQVQEAQTELDVRFAEEYLAVLLRYGLIATDAHELTGLSAIQRLNIVDVTKAERNKNPEVPADFYVVEQVQAEKTVIWQNRKGEIIESVDGQGIRYLYDSLLEYLQK